MRVHRFMLDVLKPRQEKNVGILSRFAGTTKAPSTNNTASNKEEDIERLLSYGIKFPFWESKSGVVHHLKKDQIDPKLLAFAKQRGLYDYTPFLVACEEGDLATARELFNNDPSVLNHVLPNGQNALHVVVARRQLQVLASAKYHME